jgi:nitrogenase molybdenum-iron protein NifN
MARVVPSRKACSASPLKTSQTIGAALAFLGIDRALPMLHGSQGCTSFGLVLFVRHFRETIPMQTTAMSEVTTILGGYENVEKGLLTLCEKASPEVIGLCSTALTETRGEDLRDMVAEFRKRHPERAATVVPVAVPDFQGAFQGGWGKAVERIVEELVAPSAARRAEQVNLLAGPHLTPADAEELGELARAFGLDPIVLPDLSGSLDGHVPEAFLPHTLGGTSRTRIREMGASSLTIAAGEAMRPAASALERLAGVPFLVLDRVTGLEPTDRLVAALAAHSGRPVPPRLRRQRSRLVDAMLDVHFFTGGKRVAIGADPDLLHAYAQTLAEVGCTIQAAVTTTDAPVLARVCAEEVVVGDLEDLEARAAGADLLVTHSHGRAISERLGLPLLRAGIPVHDRLGGPQSLTIGYSGTMRLLFEVANLLLARRAPVHGESAADLAAGTPAARDSAA